jgi:hypothetical protein
MLIWGKIMNQHPDGPVDLDDSKLNDLRKRRPFDSLMIDDIIRLVEDANKKDRALCQTANDGTFAVLHLKWMEMNYNHWTPYLGSFLGEKQVKPGMIEAFVTFATPYLGQLFEGPIRHNLLTLGYLGRITRGKMKDEFPDYIWANKESKDKLMEFHAALDNAVNNLKDYPNLHVRLKNWHEAGHGSADEEDFSISKIRNQIQHAHWFLDIENDKGNIVFPLLGHQPNSIRELDIQKYIRNLKIFIHTASSMTIAINAGFKRAKIKITGSGAHPYVKLTKIPS